MVWLKDKRKYIDKLITEKEKANFEGLLSITLLREDINITAIKRGSDDKGEYIILYIPETKQITSSSQCTYYGDNKFDPKCHCQLVELLHLFKELEKRGLVFFSRLNKSREPYFNHTIYKKESLIEKSKPLRATIIKVAEVNTPEKIINLIGCKFYGSLANLFDEYANAIIFPLDTLVEFANRGYKSIDEDRFQKEHLVARISLWAAIIAVLASVILPFLLPDSKIEENQFETITDMIEGHKDDFPLEINISSQDTLKFEYINKQMGKDLM